jgi:hypothetical protein
MVHLSQLGGCTLQKDGASAENCPRSRGLCITSKENIDIDIDARHVKQLTMFSP